MTNLAEHLPIAAVERETRVSKELLRMWERRYHFPNPVRDANGDRLYPLPQVERLKLVKQLIDMGHRPGRVIGLTPESLRELFGRESSVVRPVDGVVAELMQRLKARDAMGLQRRMQEAVVELGPSRFVMETAASTTQWVGEAWRCGDIAVHDEHLFTELMQRVLRQIALSVGPDPVPPRVMLATLTGESHTLGLLMAETLMRLEGCDTLPFGMEVPLGDVTEAVRNYRVDILALSFSAEYRESRVRQMLEVLRPNLPETVQIWVGGAAAGGADGVGRSIRCVRTLHELPELIRHWRSHHNVAQSV